MADGCDDIIDDEEFRILPCGFSQFGEDPGAVWVAPVVKDLKIRIRGGGWKKVWGYGVRTCLRMKTEASLIG